MKLGISSYAYRWAAGGDFRFGDEFKLRSPLSAFDLIEKTRELGLEVLQICENIRFDMLDREYQRFGKVAKSKGVTIELGTAGFETSIINRYVHIADLTGSRLLRVYPLEREPIDQVVKMIEICLSVLQARGLTLAIENSSLCIYSCHELAEIFRRIDDPLVGACIDVVNSVGLLERPLETVEVLSPYAVSLHLKDFSIKRRDVGGFTVFGVPLGKGLIDAKVVLSIIRKANRDPNVILEQWMERKETEEETLEEEERWLRESISFVRSILQGI